MKYLKTFEDFAWPETRVTGNDSKELAISSSLFSEEDLFEIDDCFSDFAANWNIQKTEDFSLESEENQYYIGTARNAYITLYLFKSQEEIVEQLINNFIPQLQQFGWTLAGGTSPKELKDKFDFDSSRSFNETGFHIINNTNENGNDYKEIDIVVTKRDKLG